MKIAYIAHPVGGDAKRNLEKIRNIIREINLTEPNIIPFASYWVDCHALDDGIREERERGIKNNKEFFIRKVFDELHLYGNKISVGMLGEIELAYKLHIPIIAMTTETKVLLPAILASIEKQG